MLIYMFDQWLILMLLRLNIILNRSKQSPILGSWMYAEMKTKFQGVYVSEGFPLISGKCLYIFKILQQERFHWGEFEDFEPGNHSLNTPTNVCFLTVG